MGYKLVKGATIGAVSALGMAAAMNAGAVEMQFGDTDVNLYGFARFGASYDFDEDISSGGQSGDFSEITLGDGDTVDGHFGADALTSRLGVQVNTANDVTIKLEADWDGGDGDTSSFRVRQAWGEWNNLLMGRTWSNYTSFVGFTPTVDFDSSAGLAGKIDRDAQIRYTMGNLSVAAEDPSVSVVADVGGDIVDGGTVTQTPDFTARYEASAGQVDYSIAGIARKLEADDGSDSDSDIGYGGFVALEFRITEGFSIQGAANYSDGANSYLYRSGDNFFGPDAYVDGNGDLETIEGYGGSIGVSIAAGPGSINAVYGFTELDYDDAEDDGLAVGGERETNQNVFVNYLWNPTDAVTYGIEYGYFDSENVDGEDGDANRVMLLGQYNF